MITKQTQERAANQALREMLDHSEITKPAQLTLRTPQRQQPPHRLNQRKRAHRLLGFWCDDFSPCDVAADMQPSAINIVPLQALNFTLPQTEEERKGYDKLCLNMLNQSRDNILHLL
jgi:hypothetical protein